MINNEIVDIDNVCITNISIIGNIGIINIGITNIGIIDISSIIETVNKIKILYIVLSITIFQHL